MKKQPARKEMFIKGFKVKREVPTTHPVDTYVDDIIVSDSTRVHCRRIYDAIVEAKVNKVNEEELKWLLCTVFRAGKMCEYLQRPRPLPMSIDEARTFYRREE